MLTIVNEEIEVEIESLARNGQVPPRATIYIIKIDTIKYKVTKPKMKARDLLILAGKVPAEKFQIFQKIHKGQLEELQLDEKVDFTKPGVEKFLTLPLDNIDGGAQ